VTGAAYGPLNAHRGYVIDWGTSADDGIGGMQSPRGHRQTMMGAPFRSVGIALVPAPGQDQAWFTCQVFGVPPPADRRVGGIVFQDLDRNGLVGPGELLTAEVSLFAADGSELSRITTTSLGFWLADVPEGAVRLRIHRDGQQLDDQEISGDWQARWLAQPVLSAEQQRDVKLASDRLERLLTGPIRRSDDVKRRVARAELWLAARGLHLPPGHGQ
jgi:hypothetical protein